MSPPLPSPHVLVPGLLVVVCLMMAGASRAGPAGPVLQEDFSKPDLDPAWSVDVSAGNAIAVKDGVAEIRAAENTYAHLERRLGVDRVRASCAIRPGSGISWCTSLFLYWKPGDWCQIGVIPRRDGRTYVCVTAGGQRGEYDLARCRFDAWRYVAIELGEDCIRFLSGPDGQTWNAELVLDRPPALAGPPALLVVGKGFGVDANQGDLDGDYGDRGAPAVSMVRDVVVVPTEAARLRISPEERRAREMADRDPLGTRLLEADADPSYETVAALLPPLGRPREVVGVKDHPYEAGVEYDGTIQIGDDTDLWEQTGATAFFEVGDPAVRFGSTGCAKRLLNGYLPVVVAEFRHDGLVYEETVLGHSDGMSPDADLWAWVRLKVANPGDRERQVPVALRLRPEAGTGRAAPRALTVPAGGAGEVCFRIPCPLRAGDVAEAPPEEFRRRLDEVAAHWTRLLKSGMQVSVPEPRVNDACRAWLAYNALNVDKKGPLCLPHDGAGFYEEVFGYSAVLYCHALDLWGYHEDSRRYLESLLTFQKPDGQFCVRYGLPDHGAMLMALAEHYRMTGDAAWLRAQAPRIVRMADWTIARRAESTKAPGEARPVTRGLIRLAPYADFQTPTVNYYADAYGCIGLEHAARALGEIGMAAEAARLAKEAAAYRADILASMDAAALQRDGMTLLPMEPDTRRLLEGTAYRGGGYYGLVASMLLETEFLPAADPRAAWVTGALERRRGLILGMCEFDEGVDHAYTYGYWLNCLRRDDVRRVLLGFYGSLAYGMGRDTYCGVEVTQILTGDPTPTTPHLYSGTQQLRLLRLMLVREEGDDLVIGYGLPRQWLEAGKRVEVRRAPTAWGPVGFAIECQADGGRIGVDVEPPPRRPAGVIRIRLRHPGKRPILRVTVDGKPSDRFTADTVSVSPSSGPIRVEATY